MATGFKRILQGLRLFPKTTSTVSEAGDVDFDTTSNKANLHNGTTSSPVVTEAHTATLSNKTLLDTTTAVADTSDPTKQIKFDAAGTTGTSTTLTSSQTTNKVLTLPDITDTIVTKNTTDTLTNKTLTAPVMSDPTSTTFMEISEISTPTTPASGKMRIYAKSDNKFYTKNDAGTETQISSGTTLLQITSQSTNYTALTTDDLILVDGTGGVTITLFAASGNSGKVLRIKKTDSTNGTVDIDANGSETIDGVLTKTLATQYEEIEIVCDGSNWQILDRRHVQEWTSYTTTWSGSIGNGSLASFWRRVGDSVELMINMTSGTTTTYAGGTFTFSLPSGLTINTAKLTTASFKLQGTAMAVVTAGNLVYDGEVQFNSTTALEIVSTDGTAATNWNSTNPGIWAASTSNQAIRILATCPISNWES